MVIMDVEKYVAQFCSCYPWIYLATSPTSLVLVSKITLTPTFLFKIFSEGNGDIDCQINLV